MNTSLRTLHCRQECFPRSAYTEHLVLKASSWSASGGACHVIHWLNHTYFLPYVAQPLESWTKSSCAVVFCSRRRSGCYQYHIRRDRVFIAFGISCWHNFGRSTWSSLYAACVHKFSVCLQPSFCLPWPSFSCFVVEVSWISPVYSTSRCACLFEWRDSCGCAEHICEILAVIWIVSFTSDHVHITPPPTPYRSSALPPPMSYTWRPSILKTLSTM